MLGLAALDKARFGAIGRCQPPARSAQAEAHGIAEYSLGTECPRTRTGVRVLDLLEHLA
jgi:hypothetical protein